MRGTVRTITGLVLAATLVVACGNGGGDGDDDGGGTGGGTGGSDEAAEAAAAGTALAPPNPHLADSVYAMAHTNPAQQDVTLVPGPTEPGEPVQIAPIGPGHFGIQISSPYADGRRAIWSQGADRITKLDAETFEEIDSYPLPGVEPWTEAAADEAVEQLATLEGDSRTNLAIDLAQQLFSDLSGVYGLLDDEGRLFVGGPDGITAYADATEGDIDSPVEVVGTWERPDDVRGALVGMNLTYDGWLVAATEGGQIVAVSRDLDEHRVVDLPNSEGALAYSEEVAAEGRTGQGWIRNSVAIDDDGGIYVASVDQLDKVVWDGEALSVDPDDGAWSEPLGNGGGNGTGATPVLMGFGDDEDRLVVLTDGDALMNLTAYWRDEVPDGWEAPQGAPSDRVAGLLPVTMGDPDRTELQTEQAVVVAGYGALVVDNEPASIPEGFPDRARRLLVSFLGDDPAFTPHGLQRFTWDPDADQLAVEWTNTEVASPNSVPYVSLGSGLAYTVGVRDGRWTLEGLDWETGESAFHQELGGPEANSLFSGVTIDEAGDVVYGTMFGLARVEAG